MLTIAFHVTRAALITTINFISTQTSVKTVGPNSWVLMKLRIICGNNSDVDFSRILEEDHWHLTPEFPPVTYYST